MDGEWATHQGHWMQNGKKELNNYTCKHKYIHVKDKNKLTISTIKM